MRKAHSRSLQRNLRNIVHEFMKVNRVTEVDLDTVAHWAVKNGYYQRPALTVVKQCKRELAQALRTERITDRQGREVRRMHPVRVRDLEEDKQLVIWADIEYAKPNHMRVSFSQRRQGILDHCRQHKTDVESYNDNNMFKARLPLFDYNFNPDLEEGDLPTEYPDERPPR
jgi:hypothetical protein